MEHSSDLYNTYLKDLEALKSGASKTIFYKNQSSLWSDRQEPLPHGHHLDPLSALLQAHDHRCHSYRYHCSAHTCLACIGLGSRCAQSVERSAGKGQDIAWVQGNILNCQEKIQILKEILEIQTASRRTPLMYAIISGNFEATKIFIEYGASYKLMTESGSPIICKIIHTSPIIMAIESNSVTMLDYLLSLKDCPSLTATDLAGLTPMYVACYNSKSDIVKYLLDRPEWVSLLKSRGPFNATIFHALADQDFTELAELIITTIKDRENAISILGEIVTTQDESEYGDTALHLAAKEGYTGFLKVCLEVLPNKKEIVEKCLNEAGETMIQVAEEENHEEAILYLQSLLGIQPANGIGYYCVTF